MLSKVIITWNNYIEAVLTDKPFRTVEVGQSKVAWIEVIDGRYQGAMPYPYTSLEVVRLDQSIIH